MATNPKPSRILRSARRHEQLTENLMSKLKNREHALKTELAEVRKHMRKPMTDEDDRSDEEKHYPKPEVRKAKLKRNVGRG